MLVKSNRKHQFWSFLKNKDCLSEIGTSLNNGSTSTEPIGGEFLQSLQPSAMDPPPPRNPSHDNSESEPNTTSSIPQSDESSTLTEVSSMNPPPPRNPNLPDLKTTEEVVEPEPMEESKYDSVAVDENKPVRTRTVKQNPVPYTIPEWSGPPSHQFQLEVLKEGTIVDKLDV
ncbi:unnamed protein product [Arabidopsis halleri]